MPQTNTSRRSLAYTTRSLVPFFGVAAALFLLRGGAGVLAATIMSLPWFGWRYDNQSGAFFVLAVLIVIVVAVLTLLLMLMAIAH